MKAEYDGKHFVHAPMVVAILKLALATNRIANC